MRRAVIVLLSTLCLIGGATATAGAASAAPGHEYYLSLGDSLAFGYQPNLVAEQDFNPAHYRSYAEYFASLHPRLDLVNYGCPGETTTTMVDGGCPWLAKGLPLHDPYGRASSQLAAAAAFLGVHGAQTKLITVDIGSNDLLDLVTTCSANADPTSCLATRLPATLTTMATEYLKILGTLHALAPRATIALFNFYNPLAVAEPATDDLVGQANGAIAQVAAAGRADIVDSFRAINYRAGSAAEQGFVCAMTWECTPYRNVHPTTLGYLALTFALLRTVR